MDFCMNMNTKSNRRKAGPSPFHGPQAEVKEPFLVFSSDDDILNFKKRNQDFSDAPRDQNILNITLTHHQVVLSL